MGKTGPILVLGQLNRFEEANPTTLFILLFDKFSNSPFSMRQVGAMVFGLDPDNLID